MRITSSTQIAKKAFATGLAVLSVGVSSGANALADLPNTYRSDDGVISFKVPQDFVLSPKPLKTHAREVLYKSENIKGFNAGVTVSYIVPNRLTRLGQCNVCRSATYLLMSYA
jgi:hypothetical protein